MLEGSGGFRCEALHTPGAIFAMRGDGRRRTVDTAAGRTALPPPRHLHQTLDKFGNLTARG
jgi:hypothetical protein